MSSTVSITRYRVRGRLEDPVLDTVANGLKKNAISEIDNEATEKSVGWTSFQNPYAPDFEGSSYVLGTYLVFSLRVDRKNIPPKKLKKESWLIELQVNLFTKNAKKQKSSKERPPKNLYLGNYFIFFNFILRNCYWF